MFWGCTAEYTSQYLYVQIVMYTCLGTQTHRTLNVPWPHVYKTTWYRNLICEPLRRLVFFFLYHMIPTVTVWNDVMTVLWCGKRLYCTILGQFTWHNMCMNTGHAQNMSHTYLDTKHHKLNQWILFESITMNENLQHLVSQQPAKHSFFPALHLIDRGSKPFQRFCTLNSCWIYRQAINLKN